MHGCWMATYHSAVNTHWFVNNDVRIAHVRAACEQKGPNYQNHLCMTESN